MAEHDEWSRDRNELNNPEVGYRKVRYFSVLPKLTDEEAEDVRALSKKLAGQMEDLINHQLEEDLTKTYGFGAPPALTIGELDRIIRDFERALPSKEESFGCLIVDPWMEGDPLVLTHEASDHWIHLLFGDSAEQIITFRKRHLPRLAVVMPRDTWEKFRADLLKEKVEDLRYVFSSATPPPRFSGAPVYTIEQSSILSGSGWSKEPLWFLPHNPSFLLQKMREHEAKQPHTNPETSE